MEIFALPLHRCEKLAPGKQGLDTTSPQCKLMFQVLGSLAEFDPELAQAIRYAPALPCRPGIRVIGKQFGVSPMTVQNVAR